MPYSALRIVDGFQGCEHDRKALDVSEQASAQAKRVQASMRDTRNGTELGVYQEVPAEVMAVRGGPAPLPGS